jgi:hypothetical protein
MDWCDPAHCYSLNLIRSGIECIELDLLKDYQHDGKLALIYRHIPQAEYSLVILVS